MKPLTPADKRLIMEKGLTAKLTQHPDILQSLISTDNKPLLFVHPTDLVWGTGSDMKGTQFVFMLFRGLDLIVFSVFVQCNLYKWGLYKWGTSAKRGTFGPIQMNLYNWGMATPISQELLSPHKITSIKGN